MLIGVSLVLGIVCGAIGVAAPFELAFLFVCHVALVFGWFLLVSCDGIVETLAPFVVFLLALLLTALGAGLRSFFGGNRLGSRL